MEAKNSSKFHLILNVDKSHTQTGLWACFALMLVALGIGKFAAVASNFFVVKVFAFFVFLILFGFALVIFRYLWRLHFSHRNKLELNEEGLYDFASICELSFVPMKGISQIRFDQVFGYSFLVVSFHFAENPVVSKSGLTLEIYRLFFGFDLWVPLGFFRVSKIDLESQLIHLEHILDRRVKSTPAKRLDADHTPSRKSQNANTNPLSVLGGVHLAKAPDSATLPPPPPVKAPAPLTQSSPAPTNPPPPPLDRVTTEKQRILEQIEQIKNEVRATKFDLTLCGVYLDHISQFGTYMAESPDFLPDGVMSVAMHSNTSDYEEVSFGFKGILYSFGLRRDIGRSEEALLSVGVAGRVHCTLRVKVEIGELAPLEIESFIPGEWQLHLLELIQRIEVKNAERLGLGLDAGTQSEISFQTKTNIEDLKSRFGIKE